MNKCKNCGATLLSNKKMLGDFCDENCFWSYEGEPISDNQEDKIGESQERVAQVTIQNHWNCIKKVVVKKQRNYLISNVTLEPYLSLKPFSKFLKENNLMVVRLDSDMSVIKKSIL